jgi:lysylphosphatidylglycerol synthetase-like protein (DUF2156 family)
VDSLFHFVFAFIAGMAVNVKLRHKAGWVALVALAAVAIDIDHLMFAYQRAFHNVFVVVLLPLALFYVAYKYERDKEQITYQSLSLLLLVMLVGHVVADFVAGGPIKLLYPLSSVDVALPGWWELTVIRESWHIVAPEGVALALYGLVIGAAYYAEEFIYFVEEKHESVEEALRDAWNA